MAIELPICSATTICAEVCSQLRDHGLDITPSTTISRNLLFRGPVKAYPFTQLFRAKIDAYTVIHEKASVITSTVGSYCTIHNAVEMGLGVHDIRVLSSSPTFVRGMSFPPPFTMVNRLSCMQRETLEETNQITIGHDVSIGARTLIVGDVTIGTGAVIAAGSVITHDVPPYAIVSGSGGGKDSHGIIRGYRFKDEVIADLLELKWWEYDIPQLMASLQARSRKNRLPFNKVKQFIAYMRQADKSTWPRLPEQWHYLAPLSNQQIQLVATNAEQNMGHLIPESLLSDPSCS